MPDELPKAKSKKPVKFLKAGSYPFPVESTPIKPPTFPFPASFFSENLVEPKPTVSKAKEVSFKGPESLFDFAVVDYVGSEGFHLGCWSYIVFLYADNILIDQKFFVSTGQIIEWNTAVKDYFEKSKYKNVVVHVLRYDSSNPASSKLYSAYEIKTGKEELYLNGPKANKDKLNEFLHKVGKHHV